MFYQKAAWRPRRPVVIFSDADKVWPTIAIATHNGSILKAEEAVTDLETIRRKLEALKEGLDGEFFVMGKDPSCDYTLKGKDVNDIHAFIEKSGDIYMLYDCSIDSRFPHFIVVKGK